MTTSDSFKTHGVLRVGGSEFVVHRLEALGERAARLPFSLKVLLENLLRREDGRQVTREHIEALLAWDPARASEREIPFMPARVILQDFTGVPAVVDLAAMRDALGFGAGQEVEIRVADGRLEVEAAATPMRLVRRGRGPVAVPERRLPRLTAAEVRATLERVRR